MKNEPKAGYQTQVLMPLIKGEPKESKESSRAPTPEEELKRYDQEYVKEIKATREEAKRMGTNFMSIKAGVIIMLDGYGLSHDFGVNRLVFQKPNNRMGNNERLIYDDMRKGENPKIALDILNAGLKSIFREHGLKIDRAYVLDCPPGREDIIHGFELMHGPRKSAEVPEIEGANFKEALKNKVQEIYQINSLLNAVEKRNTKIGNCVTDIVNTLKTTPKQPPHELVGSIKGIVKNYTEKQNLSPPEIENIYGKASQLSKSAIKEASQGSNRVVRLWENIKDLVCAIFGKSASQQVDKVFAELKKDMANEKQTARQPSNNGRG